MDRTFEGKLMRELYEAKHLLTDDQYLRFSKEALDARKIRHKMRGLPNAHPFPYIKRMFRALFRSSLGIVRLLRGIVKDAAERETLWGSQRGPSGPRLLLGPPSTHGGAKNANSTDLVYRSTATRSGRGSF